MREIDVWQLEITALGSGSKLEVLSDNEQERAARFRFETDAHRFRASRRFLRTVLSHYVDAEPSQIRFATNRDGKPILDPPADVHFSASHSGTMCVVAVCSEPVGVDIEEIAPQRLDDRVAVRVMTPREHEAFTKLPASEKVEAFFRLWTRKESYAKALGVGLTNGLPEIATGIEEEPVLEISSPTGEVWFMGKVDVRPGYVATVAIRGRAWTIRDMTGART
jgi:4'-phosphopantetheinyl transferase